MRIIGGKLKGLRFMAPNDLPVRPTTDMGKEALFNILNNLVDFERTDVLDLFSGTGNLTFEFASRNASTVVSVDKHPKCCSYIRAKAEKWQLKQIKVIREDALRFLRHHTAQYEFIFADPPYDIPGLSEIPQLVMDRHLLKPNGYLVVEHLATRKIDQSPYFTEQRQYGKSSFSFFKQSKDTMQLPGEAL